MVFNDLADYRLHEVMLGVEAVLFDPNLNQPASGR
jgi:hypothetical protein